MAKTTRNPAIHKLYGNSCKVVLPGLKNEEQLDKGRRVVAQLAQLDFR